uniref:CxC2-like cysteine cluster KDZ transposase-associated domain-containing protein n=1 Tax=Mycena chlorophos TaxID=658473 RepID=A0ABQ0LQJ7_MYCCL|nr:predicted protein [Mycena chlorophos]
MPRRSPRDSIGTRPLNYALPTSFLPSVIEAHKAAMDEAIVAHYFSLPQPADMFFLKNKERLGLLIEPDGTLAVITRRDPEMWKYFVAYKRVLRFGEFLARARDARVAHRRGDEPLDLLNIFKDLAPKSREEHVNWKRLMPELVPIYMALLKCTTSLRTRQTVPASDDPVCVCTGRSLNVTVVRFDDIAEETLRICACKSRTAPAQLLRVGLFPCSPCNPTLAVDIQLLDFVRHLYLRIAPNNMAFCCALESTLGDRGLKFFQGEQLRIRFNNAFQWYLDLVTRTNKHIDDVLDPVREQTRDEYDADHPSAPVDVPPAHNVPPAPDVPPAPSPQIPRHNSRRATVEEVDDEDDAATSTATPQTPRTPGRKRPRETAADSDDADVDADKRRRTGAPNPFGPPPPRTRPSAYLIKKCPACFAGLKHDPSQRYDLAVCEDGNFAQKRSSYSKPMEAYVDGIRNGAPPRRKPDVEEEDGYEGRLKVPRSALDACEKSFKAADESREKASTQFFAQTGLMGLVCIVLFLVNLKSAGEKQFYSLLLLEALFQHLPPDIRVAVLYDIACQLDRSCEKWGFLDRYRDRIAFAVSVFHAFGHIWACQLVYHPHKCIGFGFENGECAERVWLEPLNESSVFKLDIDDAIWSEVGLVDMPADIPEALLKADFRRCINALLVKQRDDLRYQLERRRQYLLDLLLEWKTHLDKLTAPDGAAAWGPSSDEILSARCARVRPAGDDDAASDVSSDGGMGDEEHDPALVGVLDTLNRLEHSREQEERGYERREEELVDQLVADEEFFN